MILLNNEELKNINGGSISGTLISSIVKGINFIFDLGRALGSAVFRLKNKKICNV